MAVSALKTRSTLHTTYYIHTIELDTKLPYNLIWHSCEQGNHYTCKNSQQTNVSFKNSLTITSIFNICICVELTADFAHFLLVICLPLFFAADPRSTTFVII